MTAPLTPTGCDLTDFQFMPLDVARLRDSELASNETPEACWAAVLLWAASWHQVPAASIPNDEKWIAKAAGYASRGKIDREWATVRDGALRGFSLCDDGRLYHPVVAEKAVVAWKEKLQHRWRSECARVKKHNDRHGTSHAKPTFEEWMEGGCLTGHTLSVPRDNTPRPSDNGGDKPSKGQGEGQGEGQGQGESLIPSDPDGSAAGAAPAVDKPGAEDPPPPPPPEKPERKPLSAEDMGKAQLWREALAVLSEGGCKSEDVARSFMGKLVKDYGLDIVRQAVTAAGSTQPADAREYLKAACQRLKGERRDPVTVPGESTDAYLARQKAEREAEEARLGTPDERRAAARAVLERIKPAVKAVAAP